VELFHPVRNTPSWRGAELSTGTLPFTVSLNTSRVIFPFLSRYMTFAVKTALLSKIKLW
jgi:hypothetical protein